MYVDVYAYVHVLCVYVYVCMCVCVHVSEYACRLSLFLPWVPNIEPFLRVSNNI